VAGEPGRKPDDEIAVGLWDGNPDALSQLVAAHVGAVERCIQRKFPKLSPEEVEDIVATAVCRFWNSRDQYDGTRSLRGYLYGIARNDALEYTARRRNWQKARHLEVQVDPEVLQACSDGRFEEQLDKLEDDNKGLLTAVKEAVEYLSPIQQDILYAFAFAGDYDLKAGELGRELGDKYDNGVPAAIPGRRK